MVENRVAICSARCETRHFLAGVREAEINIAEGKKKARILTSEAYKMEQVNRASGESNAIQVKAEAQAEAIKRIADALHTEVRDLYSSISCI